MKRSIALLICFLGVAGLFSLCAQAEQHRATHLGNPATRFAPPLQTPEDLRARFRDEKLRPDFASVLRQWGWQGDLNDLHRAAVSAEIADIKIAVGTMMPFMSTRENGKPVCLRNVLWAGKEPAPAYAFQFTSRGKRYRCVTPKACSNFFVEDLGPEPVPALEMVCTAPAEVLVGRPVQVCLTVRNSGNGPEPKALIRLTLPAGALLTSATEGGVPSENQVTWELQALAAGATRELCAVLGVSQLGSFSFAATGAGQQGKSVQTSCVTKVIGIAAILVDAVDLEDPVEIGKEVTYQIKVTNQGSVPGTNVRLVCTLPAGEEFVSGTGVTIVQLQNGVVVTEALPTLAPKAEAVWTVIVKATQAGDVRFKIELTSDQFQQPIHEEESTLLY